jgi:hypothetical protein
MSCPLKKIQGKTSYTDTEPRFLWIAYEGGKMDITTKTLSDSMLPVSDKKQLQELLTNYVKGNLNRHNRQQWHRPLFTS